MNEVASVWDLLELEATTDQRAIKRAYAIQLKALNGCMDDGRFQQLHEAFEHAMHYARLEQARHSDPVDPPAAPAVEDSPSAAHDAAEVASDVAVEKDHALDFADLALAELSTLAPEAQADWLWQRPELVAMGERVRLEAALLFRLIEGVEQLRTCVPALASFFEWTDPLQIRNTRDQWLAELFWRLRQLEAEELARPVLAAVQTRRLVRDQLNTLGEHLQPLDPGTRSLIEMALLRTAVDQPEVHRSTLWALAATFGWRLPAADDTTGRASLLRRFFEEPEIWSCCISGAVSGLLDELQSRPDLMARRHFLASDPRLEDPYWHPYLVPRLQEMSSLVDLNCAYALELHFGWQAAASRATTDVHSETIQNLYLWFFSVAALVLFWALRP